MRVAALALLALAGSACRRGSLQQDAGGGTGTIGVDAATPRDGALPIGDGGPAAIDAPGAGDVRIPTADANCGTTGLGAVRRLTPEILVVLDRSISVDPERWNTFLSAVAAMIARNDAVAWGLLAFPTEGAVCSMASVSATIDVMPAPGNATHVIAHLAAAGAVTGGTPTAAAIDVAARYELARTTTSPKYLMLVTDAAPTCAGRSGALAADPTGAEADAVAAIGDAKAAGVPTFVVAPSTTVDVAALNALAVAGGYAELGEIKFDTEATISAWFQTTDQVSCVVPVAPPGPPVPDNVTVTFNGIVVPRDRSHLLGWDYTDATATAIELYGAWCEMIRTAPSWHVQIYYGCPSDG